MMVVSLQAGVSLKRLRTFLQNKDLNKHNVLNYPRNEETGNSSFDFIVIHYIILPREFCWQRNKLTSSQRILPARRYAIDIH